MLAEAASSFVFKKDLERITETMDEKHGSGERYRERFAETTRTVRRYRSPCFNKIVYWSSFGVFDCILSTH